MITGYQWDGQRYFLGSVEVDENASLPLCTTFQAPPAEEEGQRARWTGEGWELVERADAEPLHAPDWSALIAARRYAAEISGTTIQGMPIDTGRDSQALITGAALQAVIDPQYSVHWKTAGGFVDLTAQQVIGVASAVRAFVQACFDRESELLDAVAAGSITAEMLEQGWPV